MAVAIAVASRGSRKQAALPTQKTRPSNILRRRKFGKLSMPRWLQVGTPSSCRNAVKSASTSASELMRGLKMYPQEVQSRSGIWKIHPCGRAAARVTPDKPPGGSQRRIARPVGIQSSWMRSSGAAAVRRARGKPRASNT